MARMRSMSLQFCLALVGTVAISFGVASSAMASGKIVWARQLGTPNDEWANDLAIDDNGNIFLVGATDGSLGGPVSGGNKDAWIAKYDATGKLRWKRQLGTPDYDSAKAVVADSAGNAYLAGTTAGSLVGASHGDYDAWLAKYDATGKILWKRQLGTPEYDGANVVAVDTSSGYVYLAGSSVGSLGGPNLGSDDAWLAKYDATGRLLWKRQFGTSEYEAAFDIAIDSAGQIYLCGITEGSLGGPNQGGSDGWLAKFDATGKILWKRQLGTSTDEDAARVSTDGAGNVYWVGTTNASLGGIYQGEEDAWLAKYDGSGQRQWKRQFGTSGDDIGSDVQTDEDGNVYVTGYTNGSLAGANLGDYDIWLVKYDDSGHRLWKQQFGTVESESSFGMKLYSGHVFIAGGTNGSFGDVNLNPLLSDAYLMKFSPTN
jgi:FOG: WD40-like repeat